MWFWMKPAKTMRFIWDNPVYFLNVIQYDLSPHRSSVVFSDTSFGIMDSSSFKSNVCPLKYFFDKLLFWNWLWMKWSVSSEIKIFVPFFATLSISCIARCLSLKKFIPPTWKTMSNWLSLNGRSSAQQLTSERLSWSPYFRRHFLAYPSIGQFR